jgi:hypothetical protein
MGDSCCSNDRGRPWHRGRHGVQVQGAQHQISCVARRCSLQRRDFLTHAFQGPVMEQDTLVHGTP